MSATEKFIRPASHVKFISWNKFVEWAQYEGLPFTTVRGLRMAFKRKGGQFGGEVGSPHRNIPVPVCQALEFLGGFKITRIRKR